MEYKILSHHSSDALAKNVSEHLRMGWRLHGSLIAHNNNFYQSVFKEK